jgi:hypothetical protein
VNRRESNPNLILNQMKNSMNQRGNGNFNARMVI